MRLFKGVMFLNVINVEIKNKKAVRTNETAYVCDNSNFTVVFSFDEEWDEFDVKTARFSYDDKYQDVVFTGNECAVPIISNTKLILVGVFAGNLSTTTPARIVANKSILSASGTPEPPSEDVYSQIIQMIDDGMLKGEKGDRGPKGDVPQKGVDYWNEDDKAEVQEYIDEQTEIIKADVEGLQEQLNNEAHFRGYLSTNAKVQALEATPNDFAYSAESGTKWIYDAVDGWQDTGSPVPDQLTPASDTMPLVNGVASVGKEEAYARGDHRHPTDTTRASAAELNDLKDVKADKTIIEVLEDAEYSFEFSNAHNKEKRLSEVTSISFTFGNGEYMADYTSGLSFDSGSTPTAIDYTDSGILNWVGTDCTNAEGLSIFQPSANIHYDIVFYFNGSQFIGLVNGFVPATGNVVSE